MNWRFSCSRGAVTSGGHTATERTMLVEAEASTYLQPIRETIEDRPPAETDASMPPLWRLFLYRASMTGHPT